MLVNLNEVLYKAQKEGYAVGLFNTTDSDMLQAVMEAAEELRSPVIIGTAEVLLPYGELQLIAPAMIDQAKRASVPVVVHYDHGLTFERCMEALRLGFSSIMFDGSTKLEEENIRETIELVKIAHALGASVEGEIGHVGDANKNDGEQTDLYTLPEDAVRFVDMTGVDALAVAIGTAHGAYKTKPKLDVERLAQIRKALATPLVLHGGSGLTDDDFRDTIKNGIAKMNIFTDICVAGEQGMKKAFAEGKSYLEVRNAKVQAMKEAVKKKMELFGSVGKA